MQFIFWVCLALIFYTYIGYPVIVSVLTPFFRKDIKKSYITPAVSLVIAAYNEEKDIESKILNSLNLNYPKEKLEIIVGSDCSTDKTDEIARKYQSEGIRLIRLPERGGKTAIQNYVVQQCKKEIIVFSDATSIYDKNAIRSLVRNFADPKVGCVGGRLLFKGNNQTLSATKNIIEKLDQTIKSFETNIHSTFGVDGCIYAVRKNLYQNLDPTLTSDFVEPLQIIKKGYRNIFEHDAVCYEEAVPDQKSEFHRKIRTVRAGLFGFFSVTDLINPFRFPFISFGLISRKFLRWCSPFLLIILFATNIMLVHIIIFELLLMLQVTFYISAVIFKKNDNKLLRMPFHFCMLNAAAIRGWLEFSRGNKSEMWDTYRQDLNSNNAERLIPQPAVILGLCPTGLAAVRELGKFGVKVFGHDKNRFSVGYFSKYCQRLTKIRNNDPLEILGELISFAKKQSVNPILIPTSDEYLEFICKYTDELSSYFSFSRLPINQFELFINKSKFYRLCSKLKLPCPRTFEPKGMDNIEAVVKGIHYPAIIKPIYSHIWARKYGTRKVFKIRNQNDLVEKYNQLGDMKDNVIIQEIIPGGDDLIYIFAAYFDENSKPHQIFIGKKIRQFPSDFGTTVLAESVKSEEIQEAALLLMRDINYSGLCDIEFKYDTRDCQYKIIEVNPRMGRWYSLTTASNKRIVLCAYSHLAAFGRLNIIEDESKTGVKWLFFYRDIFSSYAMWRKGRLTLREWYQTVRNADLDAVIEKDDFLPTLGYPLELFTKLMQRITTNSN